MKTKERLERAGWRFLTSFNYTEVYQRRDIVIFYDSKEDEAEVYYKLERPFKSPTYHIIDEYQLDLFCEH